jgi:hypothetical protein
MRTTFWDVLPCGLVEVCQYFGETHCLHLQDQTISQPRNQQEQEGKQASSLTACFLLGSCLPKLFDLGDEGSMFLQNISDLLYVFTSQSLL